LRRRRLRVKLRMRIERGVIDVVVDFGRRRRRRS